MMRKRNRNYIQPRRGGFVTSFLAVFFLVAIRFLYFGFRYFPQLDDYIQHHNYAAMGNIFDLSEKLGLFAARPLAGLLDVTLWSWLWPNAIVGVLLLGAMYALSTVEFQRIFDSLFGTSSFFCVIYALLPLGLEGTYWMSASTRIIPGLLLAALSAKHFLYFLEDGEKKELLFTFLFQFLTFGFYEQAAVLSCALNILVGILYARQGHRWLWSFSCVAAAGAYFLVTALAGPSALYDGRSNIILPISEYYFSAFLPELLSQFKSAFLDGGYYTFAYGAIRGMMRIVKDGAWFWCLCVLLGCAFWGYRAAHIQQKGTGRYITPLGIGVLLILAPLAPFFVIDNPWFSFRGTVTSFVGIALILDCVLRLITRNGRAAIAVLGSFAACVFCICSVSEIADYRATYEADRRVVAAVSSIPDTYPSGGKIAILNVDPFYVSEQNCRYHEHIIGVTESSWALTGAVRCYKDAPLERVTYVPLSLKNSPLYKRWEYTEKTIGSMDGVYVYDCEADTVEPLKVAYNGNGEFELWFLDGRKYGTIYEKEENGYFIEE